VQSGSSNVMTIQQRNTLSICPLLRQYTNKTRTSSRPTTASLLLQHILPQQSTSRMIFFTQFLPSRITDLRDDLAGLMKLPKLTGGNNQAKKLLFFFFFFCFFSKNVLQLLLPQDFCKRRRLPKSSSSSSDKFPSVHLYNSSWKKKFKQTVTLKSTASVEHSENSFHNIVFFLFFFKSHDSLPACLPASLPPSLSSAIFPKTSSIEKKTSEIFQYKRTT
jgi:hypothetical protein